MARTVWWRIAWRNLWRNRRRTVITAAALAFGYLAAVLMVALSDGIVAEMIENGTGLLTGQVQVHAPDWKPERSLYATLGGDVGVDVSRALTASASGPGIEAAAPRVYGGGLLSAGDHTSALLLMGVDPALESRVSRILRTVVRGAVPAPGSRSLLVGEETARKLGVAPGDTVVVVAPAADGSLGNDLFTVAGVFHTGTTELDAGYAVLPIASLQRLLALPPDRIHEIAVALSDPWSAPDAAGGVAGRLRAAGVDAAVEPWTEFRPELAEYAQLARSSYWIVVLVVFAMAVFGVANTMLMATFERRREFAVVRALGTTGGDVARTVVYEGAVLGGLALVVGAVLSAGLMAWWHASPPDLSFLFGGFTMGGALIRPVLRVEPSWSSALVSAAALLLTAVLAAVYPAWRATRIPPADALAGR